VRSLKGTFKEMDKPESSEKTDLKPVAIPEVDPRNGSLAPAGGDGQKLPSRQPAGGVVAGFSGGGGGVPAGLFTSNLGLGADVSKEMLKLAPSFGEVLLSVGTGVAESQTQLDKGLVATAKHLSETKIDVITDVIQQLDDNGLPSIDSTKLIKNNVSLINFVNPSVHEWKHVALSMDLTVGAMDQESGMSFTATQMSSKGGGTYLWGFGGWFDADYNAAAQGGSTRTRQETDWASGQIRLDALLGPRQTSKFAVPAQITIGPSINFSQGSVQETKAQNVVTGRFLEVVINVRKADGSANPTVGLEADTDRFAFSWVTDEPFTGGSTTNAQGQAKLKVTRDIPNANFARPVKVKLSVRLGAVSKNLEVIL
jgi:hypothetical protein